jgi:hypothetical protein
VGGSGRRALTSEESEIASETQSSQGFFLLFLFFIIRCKCKEEANHSKVHVVLLWKEVKVKEREREGLK